MKKKTWINKEMARRILIINLRKKRIQMNKKNE